MNTRLKKLLGQVLPPLLVFAILVGIWQAVVVSFSIKRYLLPSPLVLLESIRENFDELKSATLMTAKGAGCGFLVTFVLGTGIGFLFSQSRFIRRGCYPYAIFLQTVPIVAIAPLIILWAGYGFQSVVIVSVIISLFPMVTNSTAGLLSVDPDLIDLFCMYGASRWQILLKLRFPNAVPHLVTGAKTSSGLAVIGAIVGEFFAGYGAASHTGLGQIVRVGSDQATDKLFAAVLASTGLGILIFAIVNLVGGAILSRWYDGEQAK
ncbi:MAG: ABC transporter permease [Planctomycetaceae bacterium]